MLSHLSIRNFAIIEATSLELAPGMTALTGETGAGKSILLDALGLVLGDRADSSAIRDQADRADISAEFSLADCPAARDWLIRHELSEDDSCIVRRTIARDGRSRGFINGQTATLGQLRELGELLVDIHGQHEHQSLLKSEHQRRLLDEYAGHAPLLAKVATAARLHAEAEAQFHELQALNQRGTEGLDDLRFQVDELTALDFRADEWAAIEAEHQRLAHAGDLLQTCHAALDQLYESESAIYGQLNTIGHQLQGLLGHDNRLQPVADSLNEAIGSIDDASAELRDYVHGLDLDPGRLEWLEQRIAAVHQIARKHRLEPEQLPPHREELARQLDELEHLGQHLSKAERRREQALADYQRLAAELSDKRAGAGAGLAAAITEIMQRVGISGGRLEISVETEAAERPRSHGSDRVQWLVSANPGQAPRALQKVASGGELSRISLAIQVIAAHCSEIPTLIFDEVDSGIGGGVAEAVGENLRQLGQQRQVLCVTHLPQVAAQAHQHLRVRKQTGSDATLTELDALSTDERVAEIARMLGGKEITERTLAHAQEMLARTDI